MARTADVMITWTKQTLHHLSAVDLVAFVLLIIGGLNWGLVGFFSYDVVAVIFGELSTIARVVYALVGLASIYLVISLPRIYRR